MLRSSCLLCFLVVYVCLFYSFLIFCPCSCVFHSPSFGNWQAMTWPLMHLKKKLVKHLRQGMKSSILGTNKANEETKTTAITLLAFHMDDQHPCNYIPSKWPLREPTADCWKAFHNNWTAIRWEWWVNDGWMMVKLMISKCWLSFSDANILANIGWQCLNG